MKLIPVLLFSSAALFAEESKPQPKEPTVAELKAELARITALMEGWKQNALACRMPEFIRMVEAEALKPQPTNLNKPNGN